MSVLWLCAGVIKERQAEIDTMLSQDLAPEEGEGREEGEEGMDMSQEPAAPAVASSVREGGSEAQGEGRNEGSESGEASESD